MTFTIVAAGCVSSTSPFYQKKDIYFDDKLLGVWTDGKSSEQWSFTRADGSTYGVAYTDESGKTGHFDARLFKLNGKAFLDLTPSDSGSEENEIYKSHFVRTHTLVEVSAEAGRGRLSFLNPDWLKKYVARSSGEIQHTNVDGEVILTDTTESLQRFIRRHMNTPGAFETSETMIKKESNNAKEK